MNKEAGGKKVQYGSGENQFIRLEPEPRQVFALYNYEYIIVTDDGAYLLNTRSKDCPVVTKLRDISYLIQDLT